jgi:hypothetical protein
LVAYKWDMVSLDHTRESMKEPQLCLVLRGPFYNMAGEESERLGPGEQAVRNRAMAMSNEDVAKIRPALIKLILLKQPRRLDSILAKIREDDPEWLWSRETLRKAMASIGIKYVKRKDWYYIRLREDEVNCLRRARYLQFFFKYEEDGRVFNWFDESWFNKNMVESCEWSDSSIDFDSGVPPGKGDRWIVMGCGSKEKGWQRETYKLWQGTSESEDYHGNMNAALFHLWVGEYTEEAEDASVLVIDRAPYHMMITDETRRATKAMTRLELGKWLLDHAAKDENDVLYTRAALLTTKGMGPSGRNQQGLSKSTLYELCRERDPKPKYQVQAWFDAYNLKNPGRDLKVLIPPVAHSQLNPIEPLWGFQKGYVRKWNVEYTMSHIRKLAMEKFNSQSSRDWKKQYDKMRKFAKDQWKADELLLEAEEGGELDVNEGDEEEEET